MRLGFCRSTRTPGGLAPLVFAWTSKALPRGEGTDGAGRAWCPWRCAGRELLAEKTKRYPGGDATRHIRHEMQAISLADAEREAQAHEVNRRAYYGMDGPRPCLREVRLLRAHCWADIRGCRPWGTDCLRLSDSFAL